MPDGTPAYRHGSLKALRQAARDALHGCSHADARRQHHPELSPLAWHLGHLFFVETYWLREVVCGKRRASTAWHDLFFPERNHKCRRAQRLPPLAQLLDWTQELEAENRTWWQLAESGNHPLMADGYLAAFLGQHYAQHLETMALVQQQRRLCRHADRRQPPLQRSASVSDDAEAIVGGDTWIGSSNPHAYDNEKPSWKTSIDPYRIARAPVTNAQWLAFIEDGGYWRDALWTQAGRRWRGQTGARGPQHWREHPEGGWVSADPATPLAADAPVHGICAHEADAFARWADARLPHEHEFEHALRIGAITQAAGVWQWCANTLFPYRGFRAHPYQGYSQPWFDGLHRVLRGASPYTHSIIQRATFRNFYPQSHRHVHAGLRLAW